MASKDEKTNVQVLKDLIKKFVKERDWEKFHHPKELATCLSIEASELLEVFLWKDKEPLEETKKNEKIMSKIREELADVFICALNLANRLDLDVSEIVEEKLKIAEEKYPVELAKGNAKKYTELKKK